MYQALIFISILIVIFCIYVRLLRRDNSKKSKWGINLKAINPKLPLTCPNCYTNLSKVRKPENMRQFLWGGFTCKSCGKEYDKWLSEIDSKQGN